MTSLIIHPDVARHRERIAQLRRQLAELFDEYIRLTFDELPALRHRYNELFGELERKIQTQTLELTQRKRMVQLFALKLDRGQEIDVKMVDLVLKVVKGEFREIRSRMNRSMHVGGRRGSQHHAAAQEDSPRERAHEARRLYRQLARHLHPDARRNHDDLANHYWHLVQQAQMRDDLPLLRTLVHLVTEMEDRSVPSLASMETEERRLQRAIEHERRRVLQLTEGEPYSIREGLDDEAWISGHRAALEGELAEIESEIAKCNRFLDPIFSSVDLSGGPLPEQDLWNDWVERMYFNNR